jgi:hypothetical protein
MLRHDQGLATTCIPVILHKGTNELLVKTNNLGQAPNKQLWVLNCVVEPSVALQ